MRHDLTRIFSGHTRHGVAPPTQLWTCPRAPHRGGRRSTSSHSTPNSMDGLQAPRGVPITPDQHLLGLLRWDQRPSSSQCVSDILWRRCMHTRTAFNGTHTAVLSEDQLGSTPDGSASVTRTYVTCAVGDTHHGTRRKAQVVTLRVIEKMNLRAKHCVLSVRWDYKQHCFKDFFFRHHRFRNATLGGISNTRSKERSKAL